MFQEKNPANTYKKGPKNPKAYQLQIGRYSTEDFLYKPEDTDVSESEDSFHLQMQIKKPQADQKSCETQHLVTNLQYKLKPCGKRIKFLRARIDTCSNAKMMPASIYKRLYNDPRCTKLPPSKKNGMNTYTKERIPVIGSCELFILHQDEKGFHKVKFQVVSVEGSVIISCATSINLYLIQIPDQLDTKIPDCARLVYSSADAPYKNHYKEQQNAKELMFSGKKCQETRMQPQKLIQECYKRLCKDRTCQSTRCFKINSDPKRQELQYSQTIEPRRYKSEDNQFQRLSTRHKKSQVKKKEL